MTSRNASAYEVPMSRVLGKVKVASRGAWLAGLGAIARVQRQAPNAYANLVREGAQFEGRAVRSAKRVVEKVKATRGFETVERTGRAYARKLRNAYAGKTSPVRARRAGTTAVKRTARPAPRRPKRTA